MLTEPSYEDVSGLMGAQYCQVTDDLINISVALLWERAVLREPSYEKIGGPMRGLL